MPGKRYICNYGQKYCTVNLAMFFWVEYTVFCCTQGCSVPLYDHNSDWANKNWHSENIKKHFLQNRLFIRYFVHCFSLICTIVIQVYELFGSIVFEIIFCDSEVKKNLWIILVYCDVPLPPDSYPLSLKKNGYRLYYLRSSVFTCKVFLPVRSRSKYLLWCWVYMNNV